VSNIMDSNPRAASAFLALSGLQKRYGEAFAVRSIDLRVRRGEFLSLLGPSGCGKTTTLQMIAGFVTPTQGGIVLEGRNLIDIPVNRRGIGIVFQSYALFPHMTVAENVAFGLRMRKVPRAEIASRVQQALDRVHLGTFSGRYPRELSGGQQQRVALARAIVFEPTLLLLDEPFSNLDAKLKEELQIDLRALQRKLEITTILVTHDQNEALALSDRVAVMQAGEIVQVDEPYEIYERPRDAFVGHFLGKTNVLSLPRQDYGALAAPGDRSDGDRVRVAVRPEKLRFVGSPDRQPVVSGTVAARIFQGASWLYQVDTPHGQVLVYRPNDGSPQHEEGAAVHMAWQAAQDGERSHAAR